MVARHRIRQKAAAARVENRCLREACRETTLGGERLCALCYYKLPDDTRRALNLVDDLAEERDLSLIIQVLAGQPLGHIKIS